jgi:hypothetical protein
MQWLLPLIFRMAYCTTASREVSPPMTSWSGRRHLSVVGGMLLLIAIYSWIDGTFARSLEMQAPHRRRHRLDAESKPGLCRATPRQRQEYANARYRAQTPSHNIVEILQEWKADLSSKERARFEPLRLVGLPCTVSLGLMRHRWRSFCRHALLSVATNFKSSYAIQWPEP